MNEPRTITLDDLARAVARDGDFTEADQEDRSFAERLWSFLPEQPDQPEMEWPEAASLYGELIVALAAARLWLVGEYSGRPRTEFNGEAWQQLVDRVGLTLSGKPGWMNTPRTYRLVEPDAASMADDR